LEDFGLRFASGSRVKEILSSLENGAGFVVGSERINDKEMLRAKIEELRMKINEVNHELEEIKSDETFITIQELDEWDEYFDQIKNELNEEQERLAEQVNTLSADVDEPAEKPLQKTVTKQSDSEDDEYWNSEF
jgi:septal ring factor EnvC (AmiA/AmiB activator)